MIRTFDLDRRAAADRGVFALLQHAQETRLRFDRHVADFVEKERAAFGLLEAARCARFCAPVKAPRSWPNSSALDQLARDRRHVDGDEGAVAALAVFVQRAGDEFLAGAATRP